MVAELIERKNKHFAACDRVILDFELEDRGDDFHISVMSSPPEEYNT